MNKFLVDTNVLVRFIVEDDQSKYNSFINIVDKVDNGEISLIIPTIVIAECCWLLRSFYKFEKQLIKEHLVNVLEVDNIDPEEEVAIEALTLFAEKNVDFADALLSVKSRKNTPVLTWDKKDFNKL
ncbi:PIN domain-containing protein, partial [Bacillus sp. IITD106]|nr:PIN domain-containing protein [Bacillus sp. IITD106]